MIDVFPFSTAKAASHRAMMGRTKMEPGSSRTVFAAGLNLGFPSSYQMTGWASRTHSGSIQHFIHLIQFIQSPFRQFEVLFGRHASALKLSVDQSAGFAIRSGRMPIFLQPLEEMIAFCESELTDFT